MLNASPTFRPCSVAQPSSTIAPSRPRPAIAASSPAFRSYANTLVHGGGIDGVDALLLAEGERAVLGQRADRGDAGSRGRPPARSRGRSATSRRPTRPPRVACTRRSSEPADDVLRGPWPPPSPRSPARRRSAAPTRSTPCGRDGASRCVRASAPAEPPSRADGRPTRPVTPPQHAARRAGPRLTASPASRRAATGATLVARRAGSSAGHQRHADADEHRRDHRAAAERHAGDRQRQAHRAEQALEPGGEQQPDAEADGRGAEADRQRLE